MGENDNRTDNRSTEADEGHERLKCKLHRKHTNRTNTDPNMYTLFLAKFACCILCHNNDIAAVASLPISATLYYMFGNCILQNKTCLPHL